MKSDIAKRILVTNDDGYEADGLKVLIEMAHAISDEVWVVAPEEEQSGKGHALSLHEPLRYRQIGEKYFAVKGTPTDCVMMATHMIMPEKPTLLLSGINRGVNLAEDMTYSGTISAAMEGTICGVTSIAFSQEVARDYPGDLFQVSRDYGTKILKDILSNPVEKGVFLNVNFPLNPDQVKGIRATSQGFRDDAELFIDDRKDLRGNDYYWIGFRRQYGTPAPGTDLAAIKEGYISITPLHLDLTHEKSIASLSDKMDKQF
ncbi:MAG: 5'/3'-nucleotidase SurE [Emcibacter sp.]|nr:5'/3'-nucleotidase SurE [Emcibacter sp.]